MDEREPPYDSRTAARTSIMVRPDHDKDTPHVVAAMWRQILRDNRIVK